MAAHFDLHGWAYAHRGLWTPNGAPENSLAAFRAARDAGYGIEFDLRPSADGEIMVFHDSILARLTPSTETFETVAASALQGLTLGETAEKLPRFEDLLALWPDDLPLLAEMKIDGTTDPVAFAQKTGARLKAHSGRAAAMSFSEAAVRALPEDMMRGQLVLPSARSSVETFDRVVARAIADGINYLAVHHTDLSRLDAAKSAGMPFVTWTVRERQELTAAKAAGAALIFENIEPF